MLDHGFEFGMFSAGIGHIIRVVVKIRVPFWGTPNNRCRIQGPKKGP